VNDVSVQIGKQDGGALGIMKLKGYINVTRATKENNDNNLYGQTL